METEIASYLSDNVIEERKKTKLAIHLTLLAPDGMSLHKFKYLLQLLYSYPFSMII